MVSWTVIVVLSSW